MALPKIGITLGDPGGIGPEVTLKALSIKEALPQAFYILFGSSPVIEKQKRALKLKNEYSLYTSSEKPHSPVSLFEVNHPLHPIHQGKDSEINGRVSFLYFEEAVREAQKENLQAVVTSPVSKKSWHLAGIPWSGHTDYLSHIYPAAIMFFWSHQLKVALYSHHLPLRQAINKIKRDPLLDFFLHLHQSLKKRRAQTFHYLVSGLNPHAGEQGMMGKEEENEIIPAIKSAQNKGLPIDGPYPPDVVFRKALNQEHQIVIALYHDQGLIPFKLQAFDQGINVTLGLPFVRTSPDHGTAFDIAGQGTANPKSMLEAIKLAYRLATGS
jgi:4-hydroxythreonine-4-phosphate dehydrogenase